MLYCGFDAILIAGLNFSSIMSLFIGGNLGPRGWLSELKSLNLYMLVCNILVIF